MKIQQLRYINEVARRGLSISATAQALCTSQSGVSKQIRLLEDELNIQIFARSGKQLTQITPAGKAILQYAQNILNNIENIKNIAQEHSDNKRGHLSIATTHTQARYVLPPIIKQFIQRYPHVILNMHQGTPMQIAQLASDGTVDFAIATEGLELFDNLIMMPCYRWNRCLLVPQGHPLATTQPLTLEAIATHPLVTYVFGFTGRSHLDKAFHAKHLNPRVVFTASDADVIKTYVRLGLGVGIVADMAYDIIADHDLLALDVSHLFEPSITRIGFRRGAVLRGYMFDFMQQFVSHLTRQRIEQTMLATTQEEIEDLFKEVQLPFL